MLASLLLVATAAVGLYGDLLSYYYRQKLAETSVVANLPRIEKLSPKARRSKERITVVEAVPRPFVAPASNAAVLINRIPTDQPVVFITIDDGITKDPAAQQFMRERELPITAFLTINDMKDNFGYFGELAKTGTTIQNHTVTHYSLHTMPAEQQRSELCDTSLFFEQQYRARPTLFRPPYGDYSDDTLRVAKECGMKAVVLWTVVVQDKTVHYQLPNQKLVPGDIILLHYKPELKDDLEVLLKTIREQHMQIGRLEDWVK